MPVFGLRPEHVVIKTKGDTGTKLTIYASQADAVAQASPLETVTTDAGQWPTSDLPYDTIWVRTPTGDVYQVTDLAAKADKAAVDEALAAKADAQATADALALKANALSLAAKADKTYVDDGLATKADAASLAAKADQSYVDTELGKKANASSLAAKLDKTEAASTYLTPASAISTYAAQSLVRDMAYQRAEPLHPNYTWVPTTMPCICIGQDPTTGLLWGVNQATGNYATSSDNGGTWVDTYSRTNNPVTPGGIMDMVSAGPYVVMNTDTGKLFRTAKTNLFQSFGEVSPTDARAGAGQGAPAGTTGRVQVFASNDVTTGSGGKQSVWLYGNYNAAASGSWPGAMIWRSLDYGSTWTRVLNVTTSRHTHAIRFDKSDPTLQTVWACIGDAVESGAGLYKSTDAGLTWTRVSGNRYGISLDFMAATGIYPARVIIEGDGTAQPHIFTYDQVAGNTTQQPAVWYDGAPADGKGAWKGSVRALKVTTEGNLFYASTGEGGAIGTRDGLWLAKGPHFENAVLLQEYTGGTIPSWRRTVEAGGFIINGDLRAPRPRFRSDV